MFPKVFNVHSGACEQRLTKGIKALNFISFLCICKKSTLSWRSSQPLRPPSFRSFRFLCSLRRRRTNLRDSAGVRGARQSSGASPTRGLFQGLSTPPRAGTRRVAGLSLSRRQCLEAPAQRGCEPESPSDRSKG